MAKRSSISENEAKYSEAETEQELETEEEEEEEEEEESEDDEEEQRGKRIVIRVVSGDRRGVQLRSQLASSGFDSGSTHNGNGGGYLGCQADECGTDLRDAKAYHRRHKVCERHAKAPVVLVKGIRQRFCQQCSRFHEISQFDHNKRSCRSRLAGHNERRRKMQCQLQGKDEGGSLGSQTNSSSRLEATRHPSQGQMMNSNPKHVRIK